MNVLPVANGGGGVYQVFIWYPRDGGGGRFVGVAQQAKAIHEKSGIRVSINVAQMQRMHCVMDYDNLGHWAKMRDTPNEELSAFMEKQSANPTADCVIASDLRIRVPGASDGPLSFRAAVDPGCAGSFLRGTVDLKGCESGSDG